MNQSNSICPDDLDALLADALRVRVAATSPPPRAWQRIRAALLGSPASAKTPAMIPPSHFSNFSALNYTTVNTHIWRNLF
jgi:hypothetical protein